MKVLPRLLSLFAVLGSSLATACGGSTSVVDGGTVDGGGADASLDAPPDAPADAASDSGPNPCAPGTCRFSSNPSGACLPPGGPIGFPDAAPSLSGCCACGSDGFCSQECECASPDTPIATPSGDRPIASLSVGDRVLSIDHGQLAVVPVREVHQTPVANHRVVEVALAGGETLRISAAHPTSDGRTFGQLHAGDWLGGRTVGAVRIVPYEHAATYDILPDSDTGTYFAGGALIGSTLAPSSGPGRLAVEACTLPPAPPALVVRAP